MTDVSVAEAFPVADLDESAIKSGLNEATRALASAEAGSRAHATAQTEINVYQAMGRALGLSM